VCVECGRAQTDDERGWRSHLTTDEGEPAEAVVYCPECAEREFGPPRRVGEQNRGAPAQDTRADRRYRRPAVAGRNRIEQWSRFVVRSFRRGWSRAAAVSNHVGLILLLAAPVGVGALSWLSGNWWLVAITLLVELWLIFALGAYDEWRTAERAIGEVFLPSFNATIHQLRGERGRANAWLGTLNGTPSDSEIQNIEWLFDAFWLQTLELLIEPRSPDLWERFSNPNHAAGDIEPVPADERERVFRKVRDAAKRLDAVIAEYERARKDVMDVLEK
jgi:hypothetical protein